MSSNLENNKTQQPQEPEKQGEITPETPVFLDAQGLEEFRRYFPHIPIQVGLNQHTDPTRKKRRRAAEEKKRLEKAQSPVRFSTNLINGWEWTAVMRNNARLQFKDPAGVALLRLMQELEDYKDALQAQKANAYCLLVFIAQHLCDRVAAGEETYGLTVQQDETGAPILSGTFKNLCRIPCLELTGEDRRNVKKWLSLREQCPAAYIVQDFEPDPGAGKRYFLREWFLQVTKALTSETVPQAVNLPNVEPTSETLEYFELRINPKYLAILRGGGYTPIPLGLQETIKRSIERAKRAQGSDGFAVLARIAYAAPDADGGQFAPNQIKISERTCEWIAAVRDVQPYVAAMMKIKKSLAASRNGTDPARKTKGEITFYLQGTSGNHLTAFFPKRSLDRKEDRVRHTAILWGFLMDAQAQLSFLAAEREGIKINVRADGDAGVLVVSWKPCADKIPREKRPPLTKSPEKNVHR